VTGLGTATTLALFACAVLVGWLLPWPLAALGEAVLCGLALWAILLYAMAIDDWETDFREERLTLLVAPPLALLAVVGGGILGAHLP
jgi:O-antigen/teichoic acid export membrane protein